MYKVSDEGSIHRKEVYRGIIGFPKYRISNFGNVMSFHKMGPKTRNSVSKTGRILKSRKIRVREQHWYRAVVLCMDRKQYTRSIHRLVAIAFIPNPDNKPEVNHIDGDKWNNNVDNLEWCTGTENHCHAIHTKLYRSKLSFEIAEQIRKDYATEGLNQTELGRKYNICSMQIHDIVHNRSWKKENYECVSRPTEEIK